MDMAGLLVVESPVGGLAVQAWFVGVDGRFRLQLAAVAAVSFAAVVWLAGGSTEVHLLPLKRRGSEMGWLLEMVSQLVSRLVVALFVVAENLIF